MNTEVNQSQGSVEGMKEKLMTDLKSVGADATGLLKEVANSSADGFAAARTKIEGKLVDAKSRLANARGVVARRACGAADAADGYVRDNPWRALGVAAAGGLIIGILLSRR